MKINRKVISDRELFEKSIDVVEFLANAKINLQIFRGENWCTFQGIDKQDSKMLYTINLSSSRNAAIPRYTALVHELGHILYETPFTPIKKLFLVISWSSSRSSLLRSTVKIKLTLFGTTG